MRSAVWRNSQDALDAIVLDEFAAEDFCDLAGGDTAHHVHLPEAILRGDVALRGDEVIERRRRCGGRPGDRAGR